VLKNFLKRPCFSRIPFVVPTCIDMGRFQCAARARMANFIFHSANRNGFQRQSRGMIDFNGTEELFPV
jgi:hypothetical protein